MLAVLEEFSHFLFILQCFKASLHSRGTKLSNTRHTVTGKGCHITTCTLSIKDTSLLQTLQCGPGVSTTQRFHVLVIAWAREPHIGYWHCRGLESEGRRPKGTKPLQCQ